VESNEQTRAGHYQWWPLSHFFAELLLLLLDKMLEQSIFDGLLNVRGDHY